MKLRGLLPKKQKTHKNLCLKINKSSSIKFPESEIFV